MSDLSAFLLARIAEDEAVARDVAAERVRIGEVIDYPAEGEDRSFWADYDGAGPSVSVGADRVRAECEAKRRIVDLHKDAGAEWGLAYCGSCHDYSTHDAASWPCPTARALVAVYADHEDFQEAWR